MVDKENKVRVRPVGIGPAPGGQVEVTAGLQEGERVITEGIGRSGPSRSSRSPRPRARSAERRRNDLRNVHHRPRLAIVISIVLTLAGVIALTAIPVAQFPEIVPPQVQVTTSYPGAGADVVE